jgi:hypothetical protein
MTFSKSNLNLLPESLFTELTADQAQMLEGGKRIDILLVRCIKAGADSDGTDELFFTIHGKQFRVGNPIGMRTGSVANVGVSTTIDGQVNVDGTVNVSLFDKNGSGVLGSTFIGGVNVPSGTHTLRASGHGSTYDVTVRVTN